MFFAVSKPPVFGVLKIFVEHRCHKGSDDGPDPKDPMGTSEAAVDDRGTERASSFGVFG